MKTIIQTIGPLYGDVVNGSVFGQPNGSVAVNPNKMWTDSKSTDYVYIKTDNAIRVCDSNGTTGAAAVVSYTTQVQTMCYFVLYSDSGCTTQISQGSTGSYRYGGTVEVKSFGGSIGTITQGTKYYGRVEARINGALVVASEVFEFTGL